MVLVSCKECGHQVSSLADSCPACGNKDILSWRERFLMGFHGSFVKAKAAAEEKESAKAIERERLANRSPEEKRQDSREETKFAVTCLTLLILFFVALFCFIQFATY